MNLSVVLYVAVILTATAFAKLSMHFKLDRKARGFLRPLEPEGEPDRLLLALSFGVLFLLAAVSVSGTDYSNYRNNWFMKSTSFSFWDMVTGEWAYMLLNRAVYVFNQDFRVFIPIYTALTLGLVYWTLYDLRHRIDLAWAVLIFGAFYYLPMFNTKRICLAAAVLFFGLRYLLQKKHVPYLICILVAGGVHRTALIFLAVFAVYWAIGRWPLLSRYYYLPLIGFCSVATVLVFATYPLWFPILTAVAERYAKYLADFQGLGLGVPAQYALVFLVMIRWCYLGRARQETGALADDREHMMRIAVAATCVSMVLAFTGYIHEIFTRMFAYSMYTYVLFIPWLVRRWKTRCADQKKLHPEIIATAAVLLAYVLFRFVDYAGGTLITSGLETYQTVWG